MIVSLQTSYFCESVSRVHKLTTNVVREKDLVQDECTSKVINTVVLKDLLSSHKIDSLARPVMK